MIKQIQKKFITISMISVSIVLLCLIAIINVINYSDISTKATNTINIIMKYEERVFHGGGIHYYPPEIPFETRYFVIYEDLNDDIYIDIDQIESIDYEEVLLYLEKAVDKAGYIDKIKYQRFEKPSGTYIIFLDCSHELSTFYSFLRGSIIICFLGLLIFLVLIILLSRIVLKSSIESYNKQKQFITNASHDLKTPLTVINASCEVLEYNLENNEWIEAIKNQTKKLSDLTNKLVFLSKMDEENKHYIKADFSLSEVCNEIISEYQIVADSQKKKLISNIENNITLYGDVAMIKQLLNCLFDNAFKYSNEEGKINFELIKSGKNIKITMFNTVDNIEKGNLDFLFDRFYRLDSSRNSQLGGHGIGLSIVKAIVETHKGKIHSYSNDGQSIYFIIII